MSLEKPSTPPCITNLQWMRQCSPSMCQRELGPDTVNTPSDCVKPSQTPTYRINLNQT